MKAQLCPADYKKSLKKSELKNAIYALHCSVCSKDIEPFMLLKSISETWEQMKKKG